MDHPQRRWHDGCSDGTFDLLFRHVVTGDRLGIGFDLLDRGLGWVQWLWEQYGVRIAGEMFSS